MISVCIIRLSRARVAHRQIWNTLLHWYAVGETVVYIGCIVWVCAMQMTALESADAEDMATALAFLLNLVVGRYEL